MFENSNNNNIRLLYEWNAKCSQLDFAIQAAEKQLASVNKRLESLRHDLAVYVGMLVVPALLAVLLYNDSNSLALALVMVFRNIMVCVYVFSLPFTVYHLIKSIVVFVLNSESRTVFSKPLPLGELRGKHPEREITYRTEQKKLVYVLSRYYLNKDILDQLKRELDSNPDAYTLAGFKMKLNELPFYEDIRPADSNELWKQWLKSPTSLRFIALFSVIGLVIAWVIFWYISQLAASWGAAYGLRPGI